MILTSPSFRRMSPSKERCADDRLLNAADRRYAGYRGDLNFYFQTDFSIGVYARRHVHVYADILVGELRVDERAYPTRGSSGESQAGRKTARGDRDAIADAKFRRLPVHRANFRVLNNLSVGVGQDGIRRGTRQRDAVVLGREMF